MKPIPSAYQRYKVRHIKAGLCIKCSRKPKPGLLHCRVCLERERKRHIEQHPLFCLECRKLILGQKSGTGVRGFISCAVRREGLGILNGIDYQFLPIREDTEKWVYVPVVREKRLRVVFAGSTTGWHRNSIMKELLVEWWRVS